MLAVRPVDIEYLLQKHAQDTATNFDRENVQHGRDSLGFHSTDEKTECTAVPHDDRYYPNKCVRSVTVRVGGPFWSSLTYYNMGVREERKHVVLVAWAHGKWSVPALICWAPCCCEQRNRVSSIVGGFNKPNQSDPIVSK